MRAAWALLLLAFVSLVQADLRIKNVDRKASNRSHPGLRGPWWHCLKLIWGHALFLSADQPQDPGGKGHRCDRGHLKGGEHGDAAVLPQPLGRAHRAPAGARAAEGPATRGTCLGSPAPAMESVHRSWELSGSCASGCKWAASGGPNALSASQCLQLDPWTAGVAPWPETRFRLHK